jgi:hypothetical protein
MTKKTENLWKTYEAINGLIRFADTKATAILAINGVLAGFYFSNISSIQTILEQSSIAFIPLVAAMGFVLISAGFAAYCMIPRLGTKNDCLIFFCDIIRTYKNATDYEKAIKEATSDRIETDLARQIWTNSDIASKKYCSVWYSVFFFVAALFASIAFAVVVLWR